MSRHSPTERIILGHKAWRLAARLLQGRCQRLRANRDAWRRLCEDRAICGICHDMLQDGPCDDFDRPWVPRDDWAQARTWAARWKAVAHRHRSHVRGLTMRFIRNLTGRVRAEREVEHIQAALASANERCNRIQADGNALEDEMDRWRQDAMAFRGICRKLELALDNANLRAKLADGLSRACQDHGIEPTPEALRAVLRRVDAEAVAEADL